MSSSSTRACVLAFAVLGAVGCAQAAPPASAPATKAAHRVPGEDRSLSSEEQRLLAQGETVVREHTVEHDDHRYVGGVTYTFVDAPPSELLALFDDMDAYKRVLPRTKHAKLVGVDGNDKLVELAQGNSIVSAEYTIRVHRDVEGNEVRFWLEPTLPHSIDDAWGFFKLSPFVTANGESRILLTYGVMVDVGPGLVRELFEERVRAAMLSVPQRVRSYVAPGRRALR